MRIASYLASILLSMQAVAPVTQVMAVASEVSNEDEIELVEKQQPETEVGLDTAEETVNKNSGSTDESKESPAENLKEEVAEDAHVEKRPLKEQLRDVLHQFEPIEESVAPSQTELDAAVQNFDNYELLEQVQLIEKFKLYSDDSEQLFSNFNELSFDHFSNEELQKIVKITGLIREINQEEAAALSESELENIQEANNAAYNSTSTRAATGSHLLPISRIAGSNRYTTSVEISKAGWSNGADTIILANASAFTDVISGAPLSKIKDAPILYIDQHRIPGAVMNEISRLKPKEVILLGGHLVIDANVERQLHNAGYNVRRIAGANRYITAKKIADVVAQKSRSKEAFLINGTAFSDGVSISAYAAQKGIPIYLTPRENLSAVVKSEVKKYNHWTVMGGYLSLSDAGYRELQTLTKDHVSRIAGANRYVTNQMILDQFGTNNKHIYVATAELYNDPLAAAALAVKTNSDVLLANNDIAKQIATYANKKKYTMMTLFGGTLALNERTEKILQRARYNGQYATVFVDAGHGGREYGAVYYSYKEKDLNLRIARYLYDALTRDERYEVEMTRFDDSTHSLASRSSRANNSGVDVFISCHHNSMGGVNAGKARGIESFVQTLNYTSSPALSTSQPQSLAFARYIHPQVIKASGLYDRGIRGQNLHVNRETYMPSVLVEYGFMDNAQEIKILTLHRYQQAVANGTKHGIDNYFGF